MAGTSVSGLISGLDSTTIISQLMQLEAQPQSRLKAKVTTEQSALTALQSLNTKLAGLAKLAGDLTRPVAWTPATGLSSHEHVTVRAEATSTPAELDLQVVQLATRSQSSYLTTAPGAAAGTVPPGAEFEVLDADGTVRSRIASGDGSLESLTTALNAPETGLRAVLVRVGTDAGGQAAYRLSVSSAETGAGSGFRIVAAGTGDETAFLGGAMTTVAGQDAQLTVVGEAGVLTSASNTFEDLMPGVDVTLGPGTTPKSEVTVTVRRDDTAVREQAADLVTSLTAVITDLDALTSTGGVGKKTGPMAGNATLRSVRDQFFSAVTGGVDGASLNSVGITVDRYGAVSFDAEAFEAAYTRDPAAVTAMFTTGTDSGLAERLATLADQVGHPTTGVVTAAIQGRTSTIDRLRDDIAGWDVRLELKRTTLERQYGALEVALGKLQSQSSWLAGQISSLPTNLSGT